LTSDPRTDAPTRIAYQRVITRLKALANAKKIAGMARVGITATGTLGISIPILRQLAREIGRDHALARRLWNSGIHEARILASFVADPAQVTEAQADRWVGDFDSWDVCDQVTGVFERTSFARKKIVQWAADDREFVMRAAFAMIAGLAVPDKTAGNAQFERFLPLIRRASTDERNFVRKAVNWSPRNIGKGIGDYTDGPCSLPVRSHASIPLRRDGLPSTHCENCRVMLFSSGCGGSDTRVVRGERSQHLLARPH